MRVVIAEYGSLAEAQRALQGLESQISIGNIVIRDQTQHKWRRRDRGRDGSLDAEHTADFVVSMSGTAERIDQARALLRAKATNKA